MKTLGTLVLFIASISPLTAGKVLEQTIKGAPDIGRIDVVSFAPENVLLIGDGQKARIIAVKVSDAPRSEEAFEPIKNLNSEIAGRLGVPAEDAEILDLAVNPESGIPYLAVRKQDDKTYVILRIQPNREIELVSLSDVEYASIPMLNGDGAPISKITDVVWVGDRLVAAGRASDAFASKIFAVDGPIDHDKPGQVYSAETYHISHRRWETKAPMSVMIPYQENGKNYIVGAFSCTPVVKYPIDDLEPGAKIKGISMIELGSGNRPIDMFAYDAEGAGSSILTNTFRFHHEKRPFGPSAHLAFRFDEGLLGNAEKVNEQATRRLDASTPESERIEIAEPFHGVVQMDRLNQKTALALREGEGGGLDLVTIALP
mgnify:CR=1 FL=1|tara:strand:- start:9255 stop:10373 length:1119 start_codon:yes stop_codon:yes gene_type:complete